MAVLAEAKPVAGRLDPALLLKEAGAIAGIVFALTIALVGLRTKDVPGGLDIVRDYRCLLRAAWFDLATRRARATRVVGEPAVRAGIDGTLVIRATVGTTCRTWALFAV